MLVFRRAKGDAIIVGDSIVEVVEIRGDRVRLAISAPAQITVRRSQVYDAVVRERAAPVTRTNAAPRKPKQVPKPIREEANGLVLSRKPHDCIVIDNDITVIVIDIRIDRDPRTVPLGVEAPNQIRVHRKEFWEAIMSASAVRRPRRKSPRRQ